MKLTPKQDSYYGASEYTDPDYEPVGKAPQKGKGWISLWVILVFFICSLCALCQLGLEGAGL